MRRWLMMLVIAAATCGKAQAETARTSIAVSVTVIDQCVVRSASRTATCTGGAGYEVGIARETVRLPPADRSAALGDDTRIRSAGVATRPVAPRVDMDAIRVTYTF